MSKKDTDIAISVKNVSKSFKLPHEKQNSVKGMALNIFRGSRKYEKQQVLNDISFDVKKGEFFGIVGRNGSGKSTLLKLISQIYTPDSGSITVNGKLTPFIELGVGFNPELTGRENVFLNGALLGFTRPEMEDMYDEIVEFAELERFMDQKLKNYSSGMQVRLAFSIAIRANTDILVLDEVLAVGDEAFQRKCFSYFAKLKRNKKTVILVTHSMESVQQFCDRAILLEQGEIVQQGESHEVARSYSKMFLATNDDNGITNAHNDAFDIKASYSKTETKINLGVDITPLSELETPVLGMYLRKENGEIIWRWASDDMTDFNKGLNISITKGKMIKIALSLNNVLPSDRFMLTVLVRKQDKTEEYAKYEDILIFDNYSSSFYDKFWKLNNKISIEYGK